MADGNELYIHTWSAALQATGKRRTYPFRLAGMRGRGAAGLGRARGFPLLLAARVARLTVVRHRLVRRDGLYVTALFLHSQRSSPYHTPLINAAIMSVSNYNEFALNRYGTGYFYSIIDKPLGMVS